MKKLAAFFALMVLPGFAFASSGEGRMSKFELTGFYGLQFVSPSDLNSFITQSNATATVPLKTVSQATAFGGEFLFNVNPSFGIGGRYTSATADTGAGTISGGPAEGKVTETDISLVAKYQIHRGRWAWYLGAAGGPATTFKLTQTAGPTTTDYSNTGVLALRGILGFRVDFGVLGLSLEGGYQAIKASSVADSAGNKFQNAGKDIAIDLSGAYAQAGVGINF